MSGFFQLLRDQKGGFWKTQLEPVLHTVFKQRHSCSEVGVINGAPRIDLTRLHAHEMTNQQIYCTQQKKKACDRRVALLRMPQQLSHCTRHARPNPGKPHLCARARALGRTDARGRRGGGAKGRPPRVDVPWTSTWRVRLHCGLLGPGLVAAGVPARTQCPRA